MTWRETYEKWLNSPALSEEEWKELDAIRDDPKEIEDRFYAPLVFGTAGLRGIMGLGTNRMNIHVMPAKPPRSWPRTACMCAFLNLCGPRRS